MHSILVSPLTIFRCSIVICMLVLSDCVCAQLPPARFHQLKRDERLMSSLYHCLAEDEYGFIWFGSYDGGGLYRYDGYDLKSFVIDPSHLHESLPSNRVNTVFSYGDTNLYVGTHGGMAILNLVTGEMQCFADNINSLPNYRAFYIEPILPDSVRRCTWMGTIGLCRLDWDTDSIECYIAADEKNQTEVPVGVVDLLADRNDKNTLWIGARRGLYSYQIDQREFRYYGAPYGEITSALDLHQDNDGAIWIAGEVKSSATRNSVMCYIPHSLTWKQYPLTVSNDEKILDPGIPYKILPAEEDGYYWVSTHQCVGLLNIATGTYEAWSYDQNNPAGLLDNGFFRSMLTDRHGRLWISSWQGIQYAINTQTKDSKERFLPKVAITDIRVSDALVDMPKPLLYQKELILEVDQREIAIRYVLPNPLDIQEVTYAYQLEGWDSEWQHTDQRIAQYSRLAGGAYTFLVRAKQADGNWGEITRLPISIEKKLSEFALFWILCFTLLGGIIFGANRYLISRARKQEKLKANFDRRVSEVEMQALRAQMNPHFLFNSLNSIKYYALSKDKDATAAYLTKFSLLVRTILNNSKSRTISLKDELEALRLYIEIEHLRLEGRFEYQLDIDSGIRIEQAQIPPMILQPFVENAIWHGIMHLPANGKLTVQVKDLSTQIQCIIEDNGIGRAKAEKINANGSGHKKSMGLQITGDRIALINRIYGIDTQVHVIDLINAQGNPEGTRVVVNIPVINIFDD